MLWCVYHQKDNFFFLEIFFFFFFLSSPLTTMANTIVENIQRIPPVTRFFTLASVMTCLAITSFDALPGLFCNYHTLSNDFAGIYKVYQKGNSFNTAKAIALQVINSYKFLTSTLIPSDVLSSQRWNALMDIYFFYTFSNHLEAYGGKFNGNFPDYLWYAITCGTMVNVFALFYNAFFDPMPIFPHDCLLACLTYTWSRANKNAKINLMGIVPIKAYYLPLGNILIKLILRGPSGLVDTIIGILSGYLYLCIQLNTLPVYNLLPDAYGKNTEQHTDARRVGILRYVDNGGSQYEYIGDSIYDKGYWKAPKFFYNLLGYPSKNSVRTTAFDSTPRNEESATTGYSWFGSGATAFRGKGHRLGS